MDTSITQARWFALVDDTIVTTPRQVIPVSLLKGLAKVPEGKPIFRDHNTPYDPEVTENQDIDLSEGNVFHTRASNREDCKGPLKAEPKIALVLDDHFEMISKHEFSPRFLRQLFGQEENVEILRDFESPNDDPIDDEESLLFIDGPVFISRAKPTEFKIILNGRPKVVSSRSLSYQEVIQLAFGTADLDRTAYTVTYARGPDCNREGSMVKGQSVNIKTGMIFNVSATDKS